MRTHLQCLEPRVPVAARVPRGVPRAVAQERVRSLCVRAQRSVVDLCHFPPWVSSFIAVTFIILIVIPWLCGRSSVRCRLPDMSHRPQAAHACTQVPAVHTHAWTRDRLVSRRRNSLGSARSARQTPRSMSSTVTQVHAFAHACVCVRAHVFALDAAQCAQHDSYVLLHVCACPCCTSLRQASVCRVAMCFNRIRVCVARGVGLAYAARPHAG